MNTETHQKITATHLKRNAYLYVRQSTMRQVVENTESTQRQYALRQRAIALGWRQDQIIVIDSDLGQSGASAVDREGFQKLVGETGMGRAGIVLGLEVSRLARNSADWHRLSCAPDARLPGPVQYRPVPCRFRRRASENLRGLQPKRPIGPNRNR